MASASYFLTAQAIADLQGISTYIGQHSVAAADRVLDVLYETFSFLAENPEVGSGRDDIIAGVRVFSPPKPAHNYVIAFFKNDKGIEIAAIVHGARDWPSLLP
jgi:toxin ParE1/3/4